MAISPLSFVKDARPAALVGHVIDAARALASEARSASRGAAFGDVVGSSGGKLDAHRDGAQTPAEAVGHLGNGAATVFSALTGSSTDANRRDRGAEDSGQMIRQAMEGADRSGLPGADVLAPARRPEPVPPTIAGIHQLYNKLRAMR